MSDSGMTFSPADHTEAELVSTTHTMYSGTTIIVAIFHSSSQAKRVRAAIVVRFKLGPLAALKSRATTSSSEVCRPSEELGSTECGWCP